MCLDYSYLSSHDVIVRPLDDSFDYKSAHFLEKHNPDWYLLNNAY